MPIYTGTVYNYKESDGLAIDVKAAHIFSPTWPIVQTYKTNFIKNRPQAISIYTSAYWAHVMPKINSNVGRAEMDRLYRILQAGGDVTLLCFCNVMRGDFCHRVIMAQWLSTTFEIPYYGERGWPYGQKR